MDSREQRIRERAHSLWEADGGIHGRHIHHWLQAEREIDKGDGELGPDDEPRLDALREAKRQHSDTFLVPSDLEDVDQREAAPGTREHP